MLWYLRGTEYVGPSPPQVIMRPNIIECRHSSAISVSA